MNARTLVATSALAFAGAGLWAVAGGRLEQTGGFDYQPNPLGLKRSPYGQVLAMAIQAPIDADWHGGIELHGSGCGHSDCEHEHHSHSGDCDHEDHEVELAQHAEHHHDCDDPHCGHDHSDTEAPSSLLERLHLAVTRRTNPNPPTPGHKFYLRGEIEKKLRFAYELDPSHYANYNAYHLFLTHNELGTSGESYDAASLHAASLAKATIRYCLADQNDPRPALTAASAAYNILEIMVSRPADHEIAAMREQLGVLDFCLHRHFELLDASTRDGSWSLLSQMRQNEVLERSKLTLKLREAADKTIARLEKESATTASHDPS